MRIAPNPRGPDPEYQARLTWDDVDWLGKTTRLPIGLKGLLTVRAARRAVEAGVRVVWVSSQGGRQLAHAEGAVDALPRIVDAVGGRAEIVVDGGFGRGTDVLKGLARGAAVVAGGRGGPWGRGPAGAAGGAALWGLAADGAAGVACALDILRRELRTTMALAGQTCVRRLDPELV